MNMFCFTKKIFFIFLCMTGSASIVHAQTVFHLNLKNDIIFSGSVATVFTGLEMYQYFSSSDKWNGTVYNKANLNTLDRTFLHPYNSMTDTISNVTLAAGLAVPLAVVVTPLILQRPGWQDPVTAATMFAETILLAQTSAQFLKISISRTRPYMYYDTLAPQSLLDSGDWNKSFPSAHTATAFAAAVFCSYTFSEYYPDSKFRIPVYAASFICAGSTAVLRILSGNHFATDVIAGAFLGSICGFAVPAAHKLSTSKNQFSITPLGFSVRHLF